MKSTQMLSYSPWETFRLFSHLPPQHLIHQPGLINLTSSTHPESCLLPSVPTTLPQSELPSSFILTNVKGAHWPPSLFFSLSFDSISMHSGWSNPFPMEIRRHQLLLESLQGLPMRHLTRQQNLPQSWLPSGLTSFLPTPTSAGFQPFWSPLLHTPRWSCQQLVPLPWLHTLFFTQLCHLLGVTSQLPKVIFFHQPL